MKRHNATVRIELLLILVLLGFTNQAHGQACTPPPSGLVAWWPGDGNYNDIVGSNNGTPANNVLFRAGEVGQAFSLNEPGPIDPYNCPSCAYIAITNNLPSSTVAVTVAAWVYPDQSQLSQGSIQWVYTQFGATGGGTGTSGPQLGIAGGSINWRPNGDNEGGVSFGIPANAWTFLVGTYDSATGLSLLYVNSNVVWSQTITGSVPVPLTYTPYIGKRIDFSRGHGQEFWVGRIDELQIFSRALSASEIRTIYNAGSAGECKANSTQLSFQAPMPLNLPASGNDVTIGDFNRDGILDIAATAGDPQSGAAQNFIFLGLGGGAFGSPTTYAPGPLCFSAGQLKTADINNDGILDLILALGGSNGGCFGDLMSVQLGNGMGGFGSGITTAAGGSLLSFAIGDFNEDGKLDLAVRSADDDAILILLGNGDGTFTAGATLQTSGEYPENIVAVDLNGDGHLDLAATYADGVRVFFGDGTGNFSNPVPYPITNPSFFGIASGDFNEDGIPDLAVSNGSQGAVYILLGTGAGQFATPVSFPAGTNPQSEVIVADFDRDGHQDIAVGNCNANTVTVLKGDGHGGFAAPATFPAGAGSSCRLASADLNDDGLPDLVTTSTAGAEVLLNSSQFNYTLTVSISGSGTVTSTDGFIHCPGTCSHLYPANMPVTLNAMHATGWTFAGWSGGGCSGTGSCDVTMTQNLSVTGTFSQQDFLLAVSITSPSGSGTVMSMDGGINCPGTCGNSYPVNTPVTLSATPALGWSFAGWGGACSGNGSCNVTMTQDLSVTATFTQNSNNYSLAVSISGSGTVTGMDINCPGMCNYTYPNNTQVTLTASPGQGGTFSGWSGACTGTGPCTVTMTQNLSALATFTAQQDLVTHSFGNGNDGQKPYASLISDSTGNLYGTTSTDGMYGKGTVFEVSPNGTETMLHNFGSGNDGQTPLGNAIFDSAGNLYGTTSGGGIFGNGTVFELSPNGIETVLYNFGNGGDGQNPSAGLIFDTSGNLYGTTVNGGAFGSGTVFELSPNGAGGWTETGLYSFGSNGPSDGLNPDGGLIFDSSGNLYGTTVHGGAFGGGTVFELLLNPHGCCRESPVYSFGSGMDGANPYAGVIFDSLGNLYGTTANGGANSEGTAFELSPNGGGGWMEAFLYGFGSGMDGANPFSTLVFDNSGNLYGTTTNGGLYSNGTVFELSPSNHGCCRESLVYSFENGNDGRNPYAGLLFNASGNLYGTTVSGGVFGGGTVFGLTPGFAPVVELFLYPASMDFGLQGVDAPNTPQKATLTNYGIAPLRITSIAITGADNGDFSESNDCPIIPLSLLPGDHCQMTVVFSPIGSGMRNADLTITDSVPTSPQMVPLTGIGVGGKGKPK